MVESLQASPSATTRQVAQSFYKIDRSAKKAHGWQNTFLRHLSAGGGFDIHYSIFDIYPPLEDSLFQSFFSDLTGRLFCRRLG